MYGGNKNKRDKVKGHKGPQRQGWCGEACIHVHLCLFVKGTKKLTTWSPPDSQVPEETASLPGACIMKRPPMLKGFFLDTQ